MLEEGLCTQCGKNPASEKGRTCDSCRKRLNEQAKSPKRRAKERERLKRHRSELRQRVYSGYGNQCNCCGEQNLTFLTIDHVNGQAGKPKEFKQIGIQMFRKIIKEDFPSTYQVLCFNCNCGRFRNGGVCPHLQN